MSVINQMLNQLEQRGAPLDARQVCTVQTESAPRNGKRAGKIALLLAIVMLLVWRFWPTPAALAEKALSEAVLAEATATLLPPASRLSFELSSVPQPIVARLEKAVKPLVPPAEPVHPVAAQPAQSLEVANPVVKQVSTMQLADAEFRKAVALMQQGRIKDALAGYESALRIDAGHEAARQAWVALLLEHKRGAEAEQVLQDGLKHNASQSGFAMLLARLQVERGEPDQAIATLETSLPHVGQQAEYQAFYAALLQRKNRHLEAVEHYQIALKTSPNKGIWLMGYAISLQALARTTEAKSEYQRALDSQTLSPELQAFLRQKLNGL